MKVPNLAPGRSEGMTLSSMDEVMDEVVDEVVDELQSPPSLPAMCQGHAQGPRPRGRSHRPQVPTHVGDPAGTPPTYQGEKSVPVGHSCPRSCHPHAMAQGLRSVGRGARDPKPGTAKCSQALGHRPAALAEPQVSRHSSGAGHDGVWAGTALVRSSVTRGLITQSLGPCRGRLTVVTGRGPWLPCVSPGSP